MGFRAVVIVASMAATPAFADWQIHSTKNGVTDKIESYASLPAKASDHGITASLEISCLAGERLFSIVLSSSLIRGKVGARLQVDDRKVKPVYLRVFSDPHRLSILTAPHYDLVGRRRFRVEIFPPGNPSLFYEFDLKGLRAVIAPLSCNRAPGDSFEDGMIY